MNYSRFVGPDAGEKTFDASSTSADEKELSHKSFDNTSTGIQFLLDQIADYHLSLSKLLFCAENMGSCAAELSVSSISVGSFLALAYPLIIEKSIGLQRGENDRIDTRRIANYTILHYRRLKLYKLPDKDLMRLRRRTIIRGSLVKQKISSMKLLETSSRMAKLADVIGSVSFLEEQLKPIKGRILEAKEDMEQLIAASIPLYTNYLLLRGVKGVEIINTIVLLCVTDNLQRSDNPRRFAYYCGVVPFGHTSSISIRGKTQTFSSVNEEVETHLTRAVITAISWDPQMKAYYKRKIVEGKHRASVTNTVRARIIARSFTTIRKQAPFVTLAV